MANFLSPEVAVEERDNSTVASTAGTNLGAAVIEAGFGPVEDPQLVTNENEIVNIFGKPNEHNYRNWLCAANYLQYSGAMYVTRAMSDLLCNASDNPYPNYTENVVIQLTDQVRYVKVLSNNQPVYLAERGYYEYVKATASTEQSVVLKYDTTEAVDVPAGEEERYFRYNDGSGSATASKLILQSYYLVDRYVATDPLVIEGKKSVGDIKWVRQYNETTQQDEDTDQYTVSRVSPVAGKMFVKVARTTTQGYSALEFYNNVGQMIDGTYYETEFSAARVKEMVKAGTLDADDVSSDYKTVYTPLLVNDSFEKDVYVDGKFETAKYLVYKDPFASDSDPYYLILESASVLARKFWWDSMLIGSGTSQHEAGWKVEGYYVRSTEEATKGQWVACESTTSGAVYKTGTHLTVTTSMFEVQATNLFVKHDTEGNKGDFSVLDSRLYLGADGLTYYQADDNDYVSLDSVSGGAVLHKLKNADKPNILVIKNDKDYAMNFAEDYNSIVGEFCCRFPCAVGNSLMVTYADKSNFDHWSRPVLDDFGNVLEIQDYTKLFDFAPGTSAFAEEHGCSNDEIHLLVIDEKGLITGTKGAILEKYSNLSKAADGKSLDGASTFYKKVLAEQSAYVYCLETPDSKSTWGQKIITEDGVGFTFEDAEVNENGYPVLHSFSGGQDDYNATSGQIMTAFDFYKDREQYDIINIICGNYSKTVAKYVVENICEVMKDCVAFITPNDDAGGPIRASTALEICNKTIKWRENSAFNLSTSYAVMDSGFKYMYDRYNDEYRWVPLCGDIAGLRARTSENQYPWFSEAGFSRGQVKGVVKLSFNPNKACRDLLYPKGINPVVTFIGEGTILYGDKTLLMKPSAFSHTNVRYLFLYLERVFKNAAKNLLFEINDSVTQAYAVNLVTPVLEQVMGARGIYAFNVDASSNVNTPLVIDNNQFVMLVRIQPSKSINFVNLIMTAERTGSTFTES